ncbi:Uncharacterised protein [Vibrio cholerae]|nr:Uncharacterised protein [Vibrio cholerae]CSI94464.1 Uncharacterised protein [Vibrio cholerae]
MLIRRFQHHFQRLTWVDVVLCAQVTDASDKGFHPLNIIQGFLVEVCHIVLR